MPAEYEPENCGRTKYTFSDDGDEDEKTVQVGDWVSENLAKGRPPRTGVIVSIEAVEPPNDPIRDLIRRALPVPLAEAIIGQEPTPTNKISVTVVWTDKN